MEPEAAIKPINTQTGPNMATHNGFPDSDLSSTTQGTMADSQGMTSATASLRDTLKTNGFTDNATETTGLLAPGDGHDAPRKDSWAAMKDFEGLPWYRKPAVCPKLFAIDMTTC